MRFFLNIFLIGFLVDGSLSLTDDLIRITADSNFLWIVRNYIAWGIIITSIPLYLLTGINKSIPKKYFYPLILFVFWATIKTQFFSGFTLDSSSNIGLSAFQFSLGIFIILFIRLKSGSFLLTEKSLPKFSFSLANTLGFFAANIFVTPIILLIFVVISFQVFIQSKTADFMRISHKGIYMKEKVYTRDNKKIRLIGMIHIGEKDYYQDLVASLPEKSTIILAEGVSDKDHIIKAGFSTKGFAKTYGLSSQEDMEIEGIPINSDQLFSLDFSEEDELTIIRADVDVSTFSSDTLELLEKAGEYVFTEDSFGQEFNSYNSWIQENYTESFAANIKYDILDRRNNEVINHLDPAIKKFDTVIVPWGAMHMPALENAVLERGFSKVKTTERLSMKLNLTTIMNMLAENPHTGQHPDTIDYSAQKEHSSLNNTEVYEN